MTDEADITGIPPVLRPMPEPEEILEPLHVLLQPLSAKTMPRWMTLSSKGGEVSHARQIAAQRKEVLRGRFRRAGVAST